MKYNLDSLEWQQFEELCFKCLQEDISPSLSYIEGGNDKGRDFIFKGVTKFFDDDNQEHNYIFQAKHKTASRRFNYLKRDLLAELNKIYVEHKYNYDTYCLVTNLTLSGRQFDELNSVFTNFIFEHNIKTNISFKVYSYRHLESCIDRNNYIKWCFPTIVTNTDFQILLEGVLERHQRNISQGWISVFERNKKYFIYTSTFCKVKLLYFLYLLL